MPQDSEAIMLGDSLKAWIGRCLDYITHFCKNRRCANGWVDKDLRNSTEPPRWKYCEACVAKGFKNRKKLDISDEERLRRSERMKARHAERRKASET